MMRMIACRSAVIGLAVLAALCLGGVSRGQPVTTHDPVPQPPLAKPAVGVPVHDPAFGTLLTRVSDARTKGLDGVAPDYAKRQAWNADESLLLLRAGDGTALLYDGSTYQFLRRLDDVGGDDVFWHPTDPALLYYNPGNALYLYNVMTGDSQLLVRFSAYDFASTRGEGNLSTDGRYYAVVGWQYDTSSGEVTYKDLLVYDLVAGSIMERQPLPATLPDFDWVSISPLGDYVVVDYGGDGQGRYQGVEVYDRNFTLIWQKGLGYGHSDLAVDANGGETLVIGMYDPDSNSSVIKSYRLADGHETTLLRYSWMLFSHISCRTVQNAGWCLVSTYDGDARLTDSAADWLPFDDEIFLLKLDGSGAVQRLAQHRSRRFSPETPDADSSNYFAEPHATISRQGTRAVFGSNWREDVAAANSVDAYVLDWR